MAVETTINNAITPTGSTTATFDDNTGLLSVVCNDGYKFNVAPKYDFFDDYGDYTDGDLTLSTDGKTATHTFDTSNKESGYPNGTQINLDGATVSESATDVTVTNNVTNSTETHEYNDGVVTINLKGTKIKDYAFVDVTATYTENGETVTKPFTITNIATGYATATVSFSVASGTAITVTGTYKQVLYPTLNLTNCTTNVKEFYDFGETVTFELKANTGTQFDTQPEFDYTDENGELNQKLFTVSDDKQTATITVTLTNDIQDFTLYGVANAVAPVGVSFGAINVYVVTLDNLKAFSNVRFFKESENDTTGTQYDYLDLGKYVNRIKRIYAPIPTGTTDVIRCGNYNTKISVYNPESEKITLDFGGVTIPNHNQDNTDFESEISVFIPFVGFVSVSNNYIGEEITLKIVIDVVTGNGVYILYHNNIMFQNGNLTPCNDVLYKTADMDLTTIGGDNWNENNLFGLQPFLYCKWYESKNANERNNDFKRGVISTFTGYNVFSDITPITTNEMLATEQESIYNALQQGVYIE